MEAQIVEIINYFVNGIDPHELTAENLEKCSSILKKDVKRYHWHNRYVRNNYNALFREAYCNRIKKLDADTAWIIEAAKNCKNTADIEALGEELNNKYK